MAQTLVFVPWTRSGMFALATGSTPSGARLRGAIDLVAEVRDGGGSRSGAASFEIAGPGDVGDVLPRAFRRAVPPPRTADAETPLMAHAELAELDLPWRHTPEQAAGRVLRPWIVLVVAADDEIVVGPRQVATFSGGVPAAHDLADSARWAHLQVELANPVADADLPGLTVQELRDLADQHGGQPVCRLVSPRPLDPDTSYVAAVVPAFDGSGNDRWSPNDASFQAPMYHHWEFRTGAAGDFRTLCAALRAERDTGDLGAAPVRIDLVEPPADAQIRGAIAPIGSADPALPSAVTQETAELLLPEADERGRPLVKAPTYGAEWHADPPGTTWGADANHDPRHRGAAGLGLSAGIELQVLITDAVVDQLSAVDIANQRLSQLATGLAASDSLWNRRLPADPNRRVALFWPSTARMVTPDGTTVLDRISAPGRPLPRGLFSSAARRIFRPGPARTRFALPGAADPGAILVSANRCPPAPEVAPPGLPHLETIQRDLGLPRLDPFPDTVDIEVLLMELEDRAQGTGHLEHDIRRLLEKLRHEHAAGRSVHLADLLRLLGLLEDPAKNEAEIEELVGELLERPPEPAEEVDLTVVVDLSTRKPPERPCRPVDLDVLGEDLTGAVDPTAPDAWPKRRVLDTITGLPDDTCQPLEVCASVDLPTWRFLRDLAPDWLLPGVGQLQRDRVYAFEANPAFVASFLLGVNHQALAELRWRNMRIASRCTPLRVFWGRIAPGGGDPLDDIRGVDLWADNAALGAAANRPVGAEGDNLILVFRTELFRRYPDTIVSAIAAADDGTGNPDFDAAAAPDGSEPREWPVFQGSIGEDVTFFGFPFDAQAADGMWFLLEQPPSGHRFRSDLPSGATDGARFASDVFNDPTRVLIRGGEMV